MLLKKILLSSFISLNLLALSIGETPKNITLEGENGGLVANDGGMWNSTSIKDKVYVLFYVDPDEKDTNEKFSQTLKEKKFDKTKFGSIAVINLAATWKPNFIIETLLKSKQKEFPRTIYVKDKNSVLVNKWGVEDQASDVLIFSQDSKLLFYKAGKLNDAEIEQAISIIEQHL
jgi:hypothetical protein